MAIQGQNPGGLSAGLQYPEPRHIPDSLPEHYHKGNTRLGPNLCASSFRDNWNHLSCMWGMFGAQLSPRKATGTEPALTK